MNQAVAVGNTTKNLGRVYKTKGDNEMKRYIKEPGGSKIISDPGTGIGIFDPGPGGGYTTDPGGGWRKEPGGLRK